MNHVVFRLLFLLGICCSALPPALAWHGKLSMALFRRGGNALNYQDDTSEQSTVDNDDSSALVANSEQNAKLHFQGEFWHHHVTDFPAHIVLSTRQKFLSFFQNRLHRNLLLKGGGNPTEEIPATPEILKEWAAQSRVVSSTPPVLLHQKEDDHHHSVVAIHSTVPIVPGLSIKAVSYTGCRLLWHPQTLLPTYEFTLIQDRYQAQGTKALVWLYRKVTGERATTAQDDEDPFLVAADSTTGSRNTHGLCRVVMEPFRHPTAAGEEVLRLSYYSMVKVSCSLPQRLLKILPLSKQSIEAKISASMAKQLESEVMQSAGRFHSALEAWVEKQNHEKLQGVH